MAAGKLNRFPFPGCCGITVLHGFYSHSGYNVTAENLKETLDLAVTKCVAYDQYTGYYGFDGNAIFGGEHNEMLKEVHTRDQLERCQSAYTEVGADSRNPHKGSFGLIMCALTDPKKRSTARVSVNTGSSNPGNSSIPIPVDKSTTTATTQKMALIKQSFPHCCGAVVFVGFHNHAPYNITPANVTEELLKLESVKQGKMKKGPDGNFLIERKFYPEGSYESKIYPGGYNDYVYEEMDRKIDEGIAFVTLNGQQILDYEAGVLKAGYTPITTTANNIHGSKIRSYFKVLRDWPHPEDESIINIRVER